MDEQRRPPYMIITEKEDGSYTLWFQNKPVRGKQQLLRTMSCTTRSEAEQQARTWERIHGTQAVWRKTGDE